MQRFVLVCLLLLCTLGAFAQSKPEDKSFASKIAGAQKIDGYFPLYWDANSGKMWLELSRFNRELLYQVSLPTGVGSNPLGLDRGELGRSHVVIFERVGPKILMIQPNYRYRALSNDPAERKAVEDSFARSVLWGFRVEAEQDGRVLVDATNFFLRDVHGVLDTMRQARQGNYRLDESRSAFYLPRTKGFPLNTEIEVTLTFVSDGETGNLVRGVTPSPNAVTVREHHSFVELPDSNYQPRKFDPRVSANDIEFYDYASPFNEPIEKHWLVRHRLQKKDPTAAVSEPIKPIVYYIDNGAPEPIRTALLEGGAWWNQAFEAAGFKNAFQVKVLPADADPMDVRYNVVNWVHRSTRGWSYGASVVDPRTGEIIKGHVTLGSLRIRQDFMLGTGMLPKYAANGMGDASRECLMALTPDLEYLADTADIEAMSLARIRQLSAHEIGHTLGFAHNFAASTYGGRASVMDYPAPLVEIKNGKLDLSNAYAVGIGEFDKFSVKFAYSQFAPGTDEAAELEKLVSQGVQAGMLFLTDADARPPGAAHPLANLWDNGEDPVATLKHELEVRRLGIEQFGLANVPNGTPLALLEAKFLPLYLHHRYQLQAAVKTLGGLYYSYAVKTANGPSPSRVREIVPAAKQREALQTVLDTLKPDVLAIPPRILELIPPRAFGYEGGTAELFSKRTDPGFDPISAATIAADMAVSGLLQHQRAARCIEYHTYNAANPDFKDVVDALLKQTWKAAVPKTAHHAAIAQAVQSLVATRLMDLAANDAAAPSVRAVAADALRELQAWLKTPAAAAVNGTHRRATVDDIERFLTRPDAQRRQTTPLPTPPGDPIGNGN
ncbi:MAG: zinc-dependent metalloprotease [Acidobacteriota bacterium]